MLHPRGRGEAGDESPSMSEQWKSNFSGLRIPFSPFYKIWSPPINPRRPCTGVGSPCYAISINFFSLFSCQEIETHQSIRTEGTHWRWSNFHSLKRENRTRVVGLKRVTACGAESTFLCRKNFSSVLGNDLVTTFTFNCVMNYSS